MRIHLPEQIELELTPASFGSRALAYMTDFTIRWGSFLILVVAGVFLFSSSFGALLQWLNAQSAMSSHPTLYLFALLGLFFFIVEWGYPFYFEVWHQGVTPGKKLLHLRVVDREGLPPTKKTSALRTILLLVDLMPSLGAVGLISMLMTKRSQRLGDIIAHTYVIQEPQQSLLQALTTAVTPQGEIISLPKALYKQIETYLSRTQDLPVETQRQIAARLLHEAQSHSTVHHPTLTSTAPLDDPIKLLSTLFASAVPHRHTRNPTSNTIKIRSDIGIVWGELLPELQHAYDTLFAMKSNAHPTIAEIKECAELHQKICQRYGYLDTYYPELSLTKLYGQMVFAGRQILYSEAQQKNSADRLPFLSRVHLSFTAHAHYCLLGIMLLITGAVVAALLVIINPALGYSFLPEEALQGVREGHLWTESIRGQSPLAASRIMTNNISVSLLAFALGITAGIGTALALLFNGAVLGGVFAVLAQHSVASSLLDFIMAHGVLELSIIGVAGGCGLAIGDALITPGEHTRRRSLQLRAHALIDLIIFCALCLIPAGIVEGFISPYAEIPFLIKATIGVTLGALFWGVLCGVFKKRALKVSYD